MSACQVLLSRCLKCIRPHGPVHKLTTVTSILLGEFLATAVPYYTGMYWYSLCCTSWFKHKTPNSSATNATCNSNSKVTYLASCMLTAMNNGRGWHCQFFFKDLLTVLALAPKTCPDRAQDFKEVNNSQAFTVARKKNDTLSERVASRCSHKVCLYVQSFAQIFEELTE